MKTLALLGAVSGVIAFLIPPHGGFRNDGIPLILVAVNLVFYILVPAKD